jgi:DNA-binding transcriptional LysR family regulator
VSYLENDAMQDLNDLFYFVQVVEHGGFAPAGRALGMPKSKLSRRIASLEDRLGVRLIQRSTRRFQVTELGQAYYTRCKGMLLEADAAQTLIDTARDEPCGTVHVSCPVGLLHMHVADMLASFALRYSEVGVHLIDVNRPVDLLNEGVDVALRVRPVPLDDTDLVLRPLARAEQWLVASPILIAAHNSPQHPADLNSWPSLDFGTAGLRHAWSMRGPDDAHVDLHHQPRFVTSDMLTLRKAAVAGIGVVRLPRIFILEELRRGDLVQVLPEWHLREELIHAVFASRRGLTSGVRALIEHLAESFAQVEQEGLNAQPPRAVSG